MSFRILNRVAKFRPMIIQHLRYSNKKYLDTHEWFIPEGNQIKLGLSEKGLELMNDIVFIDDEIDTEQVFKRGEPICAIESVKAASELYAPAKCRVLEVNSELVEDLDELNANPEEETNWILKLESVE